MECGPWSFRKGTTRPCWFRTWAPTSCGWPTRGAASKSCVHPPGMRSKSSGGARMCSDCRSSSRPTALPTGNTRSTGAPTASRSPTRKEATITTAFSRASLSPCRRRGKPRTRCWSNAVTIRMRGTMRYLAISRTSSSARSYTASRPAGWNRRGCSPTAARSRCPSAWGSIRRCGSPSPEVRQAIT